jgi:conjugative transfer pilus assembly protein TraH
MSTQVFKHTAARRSAQLRPGPLRRTCAVILILALQATSAAQAADLSAQMASMFGSGTLANVTGPGAYKSQTQNVYAGGELQLRFPGRNYQLWSYSLPSITAGCGGVDAYLGSMSHINSTDFKNMLEAVARSYAGLLFKAALKSINPLIESVIGDMQKTLESASQFNGNTCAMAQLLINSTSEYSGMTSESTCVTAAMQIYGEDHPAAMRRCKVDQATTNAAAKASSNPAEKELADRNLNLVWEALRGSTFSADEKTVFMNIAGTRIIYKPGDNGNRPQTPRELPPSIDSLTTLLHGNEPGSTVDKVKVRNWLACNDDECLQPTANIVEITPFPTYVRQMIEGIRSDIVARRALTPAQKQFVNMTRVPVYRMLAIGYTSGSGVGNDELTDLLIHRYAKVIAYDYAYMFMRNALKDVRGYLGMAKLRKRAEEVNSQLLVDNVNRLLAEIESEHTKALGQVREANAVVEDLQRVEREIRTSLPGSIRGMLDMSNLMRGAGGRG